MQTTWRLLFYDRPKTKTMKRWAKIRISRTYLKRIAWVEVSFLKALAVSHKSYVSSQFEIIIYITQQGLKGSFIPILNFEYDKVDFDFMMSCVYISVNQTFNFYNLPECAYLVETHIALPGCRVLFMINGGWFAGNYK